MNTISRILGPSITLVVSTCWQFSCLRLGQIFEIEPAVRQCITKKRGGIQPLSFLDIGNSFMYMYNKGQ